MIELPELPKPTIPTHSMLASTDGLPLRYHTTEALEAYSLSCARAAMERAADICDNLFSSSAKPYTLADAAAAIRAEMSKEEGK